MQTVGCVVRDKASILCGVGIVENGYDHTAMIRVTPPQNLIEEEKALLLEADQLLFSRIIEKKF